MANRASRSVTRRGLADAAAERSVCTTRQSDVKTWVYRVMALGLACALLPLLRASSAQSVNSLITGVERRYNAAQTLAVEFSETYSILGRAKRPESGTLVLRKPGRMRWSYNQPPGKLFVSDGKQVFLYTPEDNRAEKSTLKASDDMRAPMAFLLGKLNFRKEFKAFETRPGDGGTWLDCEAANDRLPYEKVSMLIAPGYSIKQLRITGRDQSELGFTLSGEVLNPKVNAAEFQFVPPPGTEIVDAVNTGSEGS
jgi:outer membrane lipoprotein carrier protein